MNSIDFENGEFIVKGRYCNFTREIKSKFTKDKDISHGISFYCMSHSLVNAMNFFKYSFNIDETLKFILGTILAVKRIEFRKDIYKLIESIKTNLDESFPEKKYNIYIRKLNIIMELISKDESGENREMLYEHSVYYINKILELLYNEEENLHSGNPSWNQSLGGAFDPLEYEFNENEEKFILTNKKDGIAITNLLTYTIGKYDEFASENGLFFYTGILEEERILYTSNTEKPFSKVEEFSTCTNSIEYYDYLEDTFLTIEIE